MKNELFQLNDNNPWGGFGSVLISGFLWGHFGPHQKHIVRTGPFVPPVTFPSGHCVVTDAVRLELEASPLVGLQFVETFTKKVVASDWPSWDRSAELDYSKFPEDIDVFQPEDLILVPRHRPTLASQMPRLWFVKGTPTILDWHEEGDGTSWVSWSGSDLDAADIFLIGDSLTMVNARAKTWFEQRYSEWVSFDELQVRA